MAKTTEGVGIYLKQIGRRRLLTKNQEVELSQKIEGSLLLEDGSSRVVPQVERDRARKQMIEANLRLVVSIAKSYQNRGCDLEDLIAEGNIGLMRAVELFDWRKGYRFSTYASCWIKQAVGRLIANQGRSIRVPGRVGTLAVDLARVRDEFIELNGQEPSRAELADLLGVTETTISAAVSGLPHVISLDAEINASDSDKAKYLKDIITDEDGMSPFDQLDHKEIVQNIAGVLATLSPREEKIMRLRFGISEDPTDHGRFPITTTELKEIKNEKDTDSVP